ncbi:MAG: hypothetical protein QM802_19200 [Agriterribacter sp.]
MKYQQLLSYSRANIGDNFPATNKIISPHLFEVGCRWMFYRLNERDTQPHPPFNSSVNYLGYGLLKYGISFFFFLFSIWFFLKVNILLVPLSIVLFYLIEIHFLFLFPIMLDGIKNPVWTCIRQTYKTGILKALITTIPIGCYMMWGLLNITNPFRNWYIGCLAIITWYQNEVRNRL